ncbi:MAG: TIM-barrel domain-containing protein [Phycisphaerae bacterium]
MPNRRDFMKAATVAAAVSALPASAAESKPTGSLGAVHGVTTQQNGIKATVGTLTLKAQAFSGGILQIDVVAGSQEDEHTPVIAPSLKLAPDSTAVTVSSPGEISLKTSTWQLRIARNPCRLTLLDAVGNTLISQTAADLLRLDPKNPGRTGFSFGCSTQANFYGVRTSGCYTAEPFNYIQHPLPVLKGGSDVADATYKVEASLEGGGGAPFAWTPAGFGILVDADGGYFHFDPGLVAFRYGNPSPDLYGRRYFRPNTLTLFILVGSPEQIFRGLGAVSGRPAMFPKWAYGFTNSQWGTDQHSLRGYLEGYRARDIPIDNFTLDFDWKDWGASHYGEFRWNPVKYSQALLAHNNPENILQWTGELECKLTGIMKPRIIISTAPNGQRGPITTQAASARELGLYLPHEKPFVDYCAQQLSIDLNFYKPECRQWYWHATWTHNCIQNGIAGFWNDEADLPQAGNFEFMHMQQALYEGQRKDRPKHRIWSMNRNFYLGSQRYAYATWSGDINTGYDVMRQQTAHMIGTLNLGQMRWAQDTGGFNGHPSPELYTRWFQFTAVCPTLRTHCTLGERRQPWVFGHQACETVKQAIRQRYAWFFYTYALEHLANTGEGVGIVRPLTFDYPDNAQVANISDQWMFGPSMMAAPVLAPVHAERTRSHTRRLYLPPGQWLDCARGTRLTGNRWINYQLNPESWMDWPLYIKAGAIIPTAEVAGAVHTAKPAIAYLDVYPAERAAEGIFYDDDGESFDYESRHFHRQHITAQNSAAGGCTITIAANVGQYQSSVKNFILRVHGLAAAQVTVNSAQPPAAENSAALRQQPAGWCTDRDVAGPLTLIAVPAGESVSVELQDNNLKLPTIQPLWPCDASLSGKVRHKRATVFAGAPDKQQINLDHSASAATFYVNRQQAGLYQLQLTISGSTANAVGLTINGILLTPDITAISKSSGGGAYEAAVPLIAGTNAVTLARNNQEGPALQLGQLHLSWQPSHTMPRAAMELFTADTAKRLGTTSTPAPSINSDHPGYHGSGFIAAFGQTGMAAEFAIPRTAAGVYRTTFRVANGLPVQRQTINVYVNGKLYAPLEIPGLQDWNQWQEIAMYLPLQTGVNKILLRRDEDNSGDINLDCLKVARSPAIAK